MRPTSRDNKIVEEAPSLSWQSQTEMTVEEFSYNNMASKVKFVSIEKSRRQWSNYERYVFDELDIMRENYEDKMKRGEPTTSQCNQYLDALCTSLMSITTYL